jgi:beta-glucosidase/6-phospho-beta-glucosidase/beta-galactosidase
VIEAALSAPFLWASGFEDTFVPQERAGHRALDEYELIGHYAHWREDLALAAEVGLNAMRWGVPWYRVEPREGQFDWRWTDDVLSYLVDDLRVQPIVDLMHYGCPFWLEREFASPRYPVAVAAYAAAFAERYRGMVRLYTPLNEPIMNALMCGRRGLWPPYLRGDRGYVRIMLQVVRGIQETVRRLKGVDPSSVMVYVEASGLSRADETLVGLLAQEQAQHYLAFDLIAGRVTPAHELFPWLIRNGASWTDLQTIVERRVDLDVVGLNFYPQWSTLELYLNRKGLLAYRIVEQDGASFEELIRSYYARYRSPIMITETSAYGSDSVREAWLTSSLGVVQRLRGAGLPVLGYTWFPLTTMIDWKYRWGREPVDRYRIELGLFRLGEGAGRRWIPTPLVPTFRRYIEEWDRVHRVSDGLAVGGA